MSKNLLEITEALTLPTNAYLYCVLGGLDRRFNIDLILADSQDKADAAQAAAEAEADAGMDAHLANADPHPQYEKDTVNAMAGTEIDMDFALNTVSIAADTTFTFLGSPVVNRVFRLLVRNTDTVEHTITFPSSVSVGRAGLVITEAVVPPDDGTNDGFLYLTWRFVAGGLYLLFGDPPDTIGTPTGKFLLMSGTPTDGQVPTFGPTGDLTPEDPPSGGVTDHGALTGLTDDDHTQYLLKSGLREYDEQASDPSTPASTKWKLYFKAGGLYIIDDTGAVIGPLSTGGGGGSGTKTYADLGPQDAEPPSTNYAQPFETPNYHPVLAFDKTTEEATRWTRIMPEAASLGSGLKVRLHVLAGTLTTGVSRWGVSIERMNGSIAADGYDTEVEGDLTTAGTANTISVLELTITTIDSIAAGEAYRIKVARKAAHANDTLDEDAWLRRVEVRSAA